MFYAAHGSGLPSPSGWRARGRRAPVSAKVFGARGATMLNVLVVTALALAAVGSIDAATIGRGGSNKAGAPARLAAEEAKEKVKAADDASTSGMVPKLFPLSSGSSSQSLATEFRDGIRKQTLNALEARGESITVMVVGDSGVGKSSLLSNLFHQELDDSPAKGPTLRVIECVLNFDLGGVPFSAHLIDSPGYHDSLDLGRSIKIVTDYIDSMFAKTLADERCPRREAASERETHKAVDVVLYFFSPHRCKEIDMLFLSKLKGRASIVPILAKADTMTTDELASHRQQVSDALERSNIETAHPPIAVICSPAGAEPRGRTYPWGVAHSEDGVHSELPLLRRFLLIDGLLPLKAASARHYELYRSRSLLGTKAVLKALLAPVQLLLVLMAAPPPRRWARSKLRAAAAWVQSSRSASEAAATAAAQAVLPKRTGRLTLSQVIQDRRRAARPAGELESAGLKSPRQS